ncbi:MAG: AhpC/TSA family protein [Bacteroidales bacterium]|nr:AhpC/TSA family protein [Bacteroidales bacterium]
MKKLIVLAIASLCIISCGGPSAKIDATVSGLEDSTVMLCKLNYNRLNIVDTIKTDKNGSFNYKVKLVNDAPAFYYIYSGETKLAGMVLLPGDNVSIKTSKTGKYTIEGSQESENLRLIDEAYAEAMTKLGKLNSLAELTNDQTELAKISAEASKLYIDYRKNLLKTVMTNSHSITSATALFQKFNENLPVFAQTTDLFIFRAIRDSLSTVYPSSEFILALNDEIQRRENQIELANKLNNAQEQSYPMISLPDINGKEIPLSSLSGQLIILSFWSVGQEDHKMFNNELLEIYEKYHDKGLEVYQVSLDIDKPSWATTVRSQKLPWISVNDGLGIDSPAAASYNLTQIPTMFVISKKGEILGRDIYNQSELEKLIKNNI